MLPSIYRVHHNCLTTSLFNYIHRFDPALLDKPDLKTVYMWDPCTMDLLGEAPAMTEEQVKVGKYHSL
jgi:hypothetical protein